MTLVSKNVYIDKLDDIINKDNNAYPITIKMKLIDVKSRTSITSSKEINEKYSTLKLVITLEYQDIKTFCKRICSKLV